MIDEPDDASCGVGDDELGTFLEACHLAVGHEVAEQFGACHAEGHEAVAFRCAPDGQGERHFRLVEKCTMWSSVKRHSGRVLLFRHREGLVAGIGICSCLGDGQRLMFFPHEAFHDDVSTVEEQFVGVGAKHLTRRGVKVVVDLFYLLGFEAVIFQ